MQTKLLINGQLIPGAGTPLPVMNPSTGGELIAIAEASPEQVMAAVAAADAAFLGELALDGSLRPVSGVLPMALAAAEHGIRALYVPAENAAEAAEACADTRAVVITGSTVLSTAMTMLKRERPTDCSTTSSELEASWPRPMRPAV